MCRLDIAFTLLAVVNEIVKKHENFICQDDDAVIISPKTVIEYGRILEARTGQAVLNGFSPESLIKYLDLRQAIFEKTALHDDNGYPKYRLLTRKLCGSNNMQILASLADWLDPQLNHPMDVIEASGIIPILECQM